MQQLRFLFAMALLYMFRVTISPIIILQEARRRTTRQRLPTTPQQQNYFTTDKFNNNLSEPAYLWPYTALYS